MNTDNNHINYSAADIQNYLLGKLSVNEMHAIEKAALNDPLLAEAIEGYELALEQNSSGDFTKINNDLITLKNKISDYHTTPVKNISPNRWRIAAAVLVVLGGIAFAMYQFSDFGAKKSTSVAQNIPEKEAAIELKQNDTALSLDVQQTNGDIKRETSTPQNNQVENALKPSVNATHPEEKTITDLPSVLAENTITPVAASEKDKKEKELIKNEQLVKKEKTVPEQKQAGYTQPQLVFSGIITGENNEPIPYAKITINNSQFSKTDVNGNFYLTNPDSTLQLDITAANYMPSGVKINAGTDRNISLKPKSNVIKQSKKISKTDHKSQVILLSKRGIEPKNGWSDFEKFLVNELSNSKYDNGRLVNGETICSFEVDANSEVINFQFEKTIDEDVNEAVKELIKFGPEWKITNTKTNPRVVKLKIIF